MFKVIEHERLGKRTVVDDEFQADFKDIGMFIELYYLWKWKKIQALLWEVRG